MHDKLLNLAIVSARPIYSTKPYMDVASLISLCTFLVRNFIIGFLLLIFNIPASAQEITSDFNGQSSGMAANVIRWSGRLPDSAGKTVELRFSLYQERFGGNPLWSETLPVEVQADGLYSILLGASDAESLPKELFTDRGVRWIEVEQTDHPLSANLDPLVVTGRDGKFPSRRFFLSTAPYALKAADAATLAGLPASEYITRKDMDLAVTQSLADTLNLAPKHPLAAPLSGRLGDPGFIPIWTSSSNLGNSLISQFGTNTGIATLTPATTLDVNGASTMRGDLSLISPAEAKTGGANSPSLIFQASTYSTSSNMNIPQKFFWQAVGTGNNTPNPTAHLDLLFGSGAAAPTSTGLSIASNGQITFAPGQIFPTLSVVGSGEVALTAGESMLTTKGGAMIGGGPLPAGAPSGSIGTPAVYNPKGEFDPYVFGAKGDGVSDDTTAIQSAIDAAHTIGGGIVRLHPGQYKVTSTLIMYSGVLLLGSGNSCGQGSLGTCVLNKGSSYAIKVDVSVTGMQITGWAIRDLAIRGNNGKDSCIGILGSSVTSPSVFDVQHITCDNYGQTGIYINSTSYGDFNDITLNCAVGSGGNIGLDIEPGGLYLEVTSFHRINTQGCRQYGVKINAGNQLVFHDLDLNRSGISNLYIKGNNVFNLYFYNTNSVSAVRNGIEIDDSAGYTARTHFYGTTITLAGSSSSETAIYAHSEGHSAAVEFDTYEFNVLGGNPPKYYVVADSASALMMVNPQSATYTYSLGTPNVYRVFTSGIKSNYLVGTGISIFDSIVDHQLTNPNAILIDAGGGFIGESYTVPNSVGATTRPANDNSTKIATTAYVATPGNIFPEDVRASGNINAGGGSSVVYRCTTAGTLPLGALTTQMETCGGSTDTGLRVK